MFPWVSVRSYEDRVSLNSVWKWRAVFESLLKICGAETTDQNMSANTFLQCLQGRLPSNPVRRVIDWVRICDRAAPSTIIAFQCITSRTTSYGGKPAFPPVSEERDAWIYYWWSFPIVCLNSQRPRCCPLKLHMQRGLPASLGGLQGSHDQWAPSSS